MAGDRSDSLSKDQILKLLRGIDGHEFESFIADLWEFQGWDTEVTKGSNDRGIDVIANRMFPYQETALIQAKRYGSNTNISSPEVQKYASLRQREGVDTVILVTTGGFTRQALEIADDFQLKCISGKVLTKLVCELEAEDVVHDYTSGNPDDVSKHSDKPSINNSDLIGSEASVLIDEGDYLIIELTGLRYLEQLEGTLATLEITNKSPIEWRYYDKDLSLITNDDFVLKPKIEGQFSGFPSGWSFVHANIQPNTTIRHAVFIEAPKDTEISRIEYRSKIPRKLRNERNVDEIMSDGELSGREERDALRKHIDSWNEKEEIQIHVSDSIREQLSIPSSLPTKSIEIS